VRHPHGLLLKSALMAELAVCAANQLPWHGRDVKGLFSVVYFALERADLVQRRLAAHCSHLSEDDLKQMAMAPRMPPDGYGLVTYGLPFIGGRTVT
jgi:hypothetical protein